MSHRKFIALSFMFFFVFVSLVQGQYLEQSSQSGIGIPYFEVALHNQFDNDLQGGNILIMAQFVYDDITFVKSDSSGYDAELELLLAVYDTNDNVVESRMINRKLNVKEYQKTNSRDEKLILKNSIKLNHGDYALLLRATDQTTKKVASRKISFTLPNYTEKVISMSALTFMRDINIDSTGAIVEFTPTFNNNFTDRDEEIYVYFDLYTQDTSKPVEIQYTLFDKRDKKDFDTLVVTQVDRAVSPHLFRLNKDQLEKNRYRLVVSAKQDKYKTQAETNLSFFWTTIPGTIDDIDLALEQMSYILQTDSLKKYRKASLEEKQAFFKRFWDERDPNPATAVNELMNEYFKRVNHANRNFSAFRQDGWLTDRGRILIKFGYPDDIERYPFEMGTRPYEIWRYYALRKTFLFEDRTGFGDYRLHPAYLDVEYN